MRPQQRGIMHHRDFVFFGNGLTIYEAVVNFRIVGMQHLAQRDDVSFAEHGTRATQTTSTMMTMMTRERIIPSLRCPQKKKPCISL